MKFLCLAFLALACIEHTTAQFFGFSGFSGCGTGSVPTFANQCHMGSQNNTVFCRATGSTTYVAPIYYGDYGAYLAVDGYLSARNSGFYHSSLEHYPWLKIELLDRTGIIATQMDVSRVDVYLRCDVNEPVEVSYEIRGTSDQGKSETALYAAPRLIGGKVCGTQKQLIRGAKKFTVDCNSTITAAKEIWIQKTTSNSHGAGWPNYNGNRWNSWTGKAPAQNSNWRVTFLAINEVVLY